MEVKEVKEVKRKRESSKTSLTRLKEKEAKLLKLQIDLQKDYLKYKTKAKLIKRQNRLILDRILDLNEDAGYFTFSSSEESEFEYGDDDPMFDFRDLPEGPFDGEEEEENIGLDDMYFEEYLKSIELGKMKELGNEINGNENSENEINSKKRKQYQLDDDEIGSGNESEHESDSEILQIEPKRPQVSSRRRSIEMDLDRLYSPKKPRLENEPQS